MLSRTADHLYWMSRYTERAENTVRMLDVNYQTSRLQQSVDVAQAGWEGLLSINELSEAYQRKYGSVTAREVMDFMVRDESNPSSVISCLKSARENARAVRGTLTTEVWETQNQTYLEIFRMLRSGMFERDPSQFFEWVKFRSPLLRPEKIEILRLELIEAGTASKNEKTAQSVINLSGLWNILAFHRQTAL